MYEGQILGTTTSDESLTTDKKQFVCLFGCEDLFTIFKSFTLFLCKTMTFQRYYFDLELVASRPKNPIDF